LLHHCLTVQLLFKDWQGPNWRRYKAGVSNENEGNQVNVSSPDQVNDRMTERLNNNNKNNKDDNVYGAASWLSHFESSPGSYDECGTAPSRR